MKTPAVAAIHRALIAFHVGMLMDFVKRMRDVCAGPLDEGTLAWVLPAAAEPLQVCAGLEVESSKDSLVSEVILSSYLLLSAVAHTCPLSSKALSMILKTISSCAPRVSPKQFIRTLASICAAQEPSLVSPLSKTVIKTVLRLPGVQSELQETLKFTGTEKFVGPFVQSLAARLVEDRAFDTLTSLVTFQSVPFSIIYDLAKSLIQQAVSAPELGAAALARGRSLLVHVQQRHPELLQTCFEAALKDAGDSKDALEQLLISLSVELPSGTSSAKDADMVVASTSADAAVRVIAVRELYENLAKGDLIPLDSVSQISLSNLIY